MIFESKLPTPVPPEVSVYQHIFEGDKRTESDDHLCYVDAEDHSRFITYGVLKNLVLRFGAGLKRVFPDFARGDIVAIYSPNDLYYIPAFHGIVAIGGAVATIDHTSDPETAADCLSNVEARILIAHADTLDRAISAAKLSGIPQHNIFVLGKKDINGYCCVDETFWNHEELATPVTFTKEELHTSPCYYYFTSGTTGKKKTVVFTQRTAVCSVVKDDWLPSQTRILAHTDFHHASSLLTTIQFNVRFGCTTHIMKEYSLLKLLACIQKCKTNAIVTQPWIVASMAKEPIVDEYDISSLQIMLCGGSIVDKNMCASFYKRFEIPVLAGYAMTEILCSHINTISGTLAGTIGVLQPGFQAKLIDEDGNEVGYNQPGELCLKGPSLMPGYHRNPAANAEVFDKDGFYRTGDLVQVNEDLEFTYSDRVKDLIRYKYLSIVPQEIEVTVMSHPLVTDCGAVGIQSEEECAWYPAAFVTLAKNEVDIETVKKQILEIVKKELSEEKQLRGGLYILDALPRTSTGKINRRVLRAFKLVDCVN